MLVEIKRPQWSRFCKQFSGRNQYRPATITARTRQDHQLMTSQDVPFMGIALEKKGRLIDGISFFAGVQDPDSIQRPLLTLNKPIRILQDKRADGTVNRLQIQGQDGSTVTVRLTGARTEPQRPKTLVRQLAYSLYERRGHVHGHDVEDWLEAERNVEQVEKRLAT